jgi:RES domain-containing protein
MALDPAIFTGRTFRVVPPRWAHAPLSGEGARLHGGRFNQPDMPAFYSSLDPHTAYAEYTQSLYDRPGLLCSFYIDDARVLDLTNAEGLAASGLAHDDLRQRWFGRSDAPTQLVAARLMAMEIDGLIYASLQHRVGRNLVLWRWNGPPAVTLVDRLGEAVAVPLACVLQPHVAGI